MPDENEFFIKSKRLGFRQWTKKDFEFALVLWADPEVTKNIIGKASLSENEIRERLYEEIQTYEKYGIQYWPIFLLEGDQFIGCCGLRPYDDQKKILEIGFHICSKQWRKGFASEAALAVIDYAFDKLKVSALFAGHNPQNEASRNLLFKLGFKYTYDEFYEPTGLIHPSYLFTAEDFSRKKC